MNTQILGLVVGAIASYFLTKEIVADRAYEKHSQAQQQEETARGDAEDFHSDTSGSGDWAAKIVQFNPFSCETNPYVAIPDESSAVENGGSNGCGSAVEMTMVTPSKLLQSGRNSDAVV